MVNPRHAARWLAGTDSAQPFQEVARVLEADGRPSAAKWVRYRSAVHSSRRSHWTIKGGRFVYNVTTGHGFYPAVTLLWLLAIFFGGWLISDAYEERFTTPATSAISSAVEEDPARTAEEKRRGLVPASWWMTAWDVPEFSPERQALAVAVPVTDLGGTQSWSPPEGGVWFALSLLKGAAWIFTTLLLAGISGLLRRST